MSHRVFISYSTKDTDQANAACAALEAAGIPCWIAPRDIQHGETWAGAIIDAINRSELLVLLLSSNSNASEDVCREINRACSRNLRILTVRIEDMLPTGDMEYYLSRSQWFDALAGPFDDHLDALVQVVQTPGGSARGLRQAPAAAAVDEQAVQAALRDIEWRLAELEHTEGPLRCSPIDGIFESAIDSTEQMHDARQWTACQSIYLAAAEGVMRLLEGAPRESTVKWPAEIEYLRDSLRTALDAINAHEQAAESSVRLLHRTFADFLDRAPPEQQRSLPRRLAVFALLGFLGVGVLSLVLAYKYTTTTWEVRYAYTWGDEYPRIGPYLEFSRSVLLVVVVLYLFEILFRSESQRLFLDWSWLSWKRPSVAMARGFGVLIVAYCSWTITEHVLVLAPSRETEWAKEKLALLKSDAELSNRYPDPMKSSLLGDLEKETRPDFKEHGRPYRWYLPYCLVNYVVFGGVLLTLTFYAVLSDLRRLVAERAGLDGVFVNQRLPDADVDREFSRFFNVCLRHTQRYVTLLLWISIVIVYETVVTRATLSETGWRYELLTSAVVGLSALAWVGILIHFYEGAFQRCCDEKRRRRRLTNKWEQSWSTTRFLSRCFLNLRSGVAVGIYFIPVVMVLMEVARR